jgi:hypothetical protein
MDLYRVHSNLTVYYVSVLDLPVLKQVLLHTNNAVKVC